MWPVTSNTTLPTFTFTASSDAVAEHEKFGRLLGAQFSKVIRERFASKASLRRLVELAKSQPELYNSFLTLHETAFPKYLAELRGIATGAVVAAGGGGRGRERGRKWGRVRGGRHGGGRGGRGGGGPR